MRSDPLRSRGWGPRSWVPPLARLSGGGETLGGAGGLGGETTTLEPQAAIPTSRADVVAEDAGRLKPGVLGVEGHVGVRGRAAVGKRPGRRGLRTPGTGAGRRPDGQRAPRDGGEGGSAEGARGAGGLRRAHARRRRRRSPRRGKGPQGLGGRWPRGGALAPGRVDDVARQERLQLAAGGPRIDLRSQRGDRALAPRGGHGRRRRRQRRRAARAAPATRLPRSRAHPAVQAAGGPGSARRPGRGRGQALGAVLGREQRGPRGRFSARSSRIRVLEKIRVWLSIIRRWERYPTKSGSAWCKNAGGPTQCRSFKSLCYLGSAPACFGDEYPHLVGREWARDRPAI